MTTWDYNTDPILQQIADSIPKPNIVITPEMEADWAEADLRRWCKDYEQQHKREVKQQIAAFVESFPKKPAQAMRKTYLLSEIERLGKEIDDCTERAERVSRTEDQWFRDYILDSGRVEQKMKMIKRHYREIDSFGRRKKAKTWVGEDEIQQAKDADIVEQGLVEGRRKGNKYWLSCPFHQEKTPSCVIYPDGKGFFCFSCQKGGDNIKFIMVTEQLPFNKAVKFINGN